MLKLPESLYPTIWPLRGTVCIPLLDCNCSSITFVHIAKCQSLPAPTFIGADVYIQD